MEDTMNCPNCGNPLHENALEGLCPDCLLKAGWPTDDLTQACTATNGDVRSCIETLAQRFPKLEILELIGRGGMGSVYKARQSHLDRMVALKILANKKGSDPGFAERFAREAQALAKLNHRHIVGVYDYGEVEGFHYFIMEYVDGLNLRQVQRAGALAPREALEIVPQICEALQFAHDRGVVHRDIKPENVLLDQTGCIKIADFGLAKILGTERTNFTLTEPNQRMGTPHYMAPEQVAHPSEVDHRADIYSLGVVFYELLTGDLPIGKFAPPSQKVQVDVRLDEVVLKALENEPALRYQQASEVKTEIQSINPDEESVEGEGQAGLSHTSDAAFSHTALWGAVWGMVMLIAYGVHYTSPGWAMTGVLRSSFLSPVSELCSILLLVVGFATPVGMTVLGWIALRDIRCSAGRLRGLSLALTLENGILTMQALGTHIMYDDQSTWEEAHARDLIGYWRQEKKTMPERTAMRLFAEYPNRYLFYTSDGGVGLLEITGTITDLSSVGLRYKRVQSHPRK
jgi:tRNA A-37 threonylcarbamoyl transferase component Bud32